MATEVSLTDTALLATVVDAAATGASVTQRTIIKISDTIRFFIIFPIPRRFACGTNNLLKYCSNFLFCDKIFLNSSTLQSTRGEVEEFPT
jgi:hypothetical protein